GSLPLQPSEPLPARDDFDGSALAPLWNFMRTPDPANWSLTEREGSLTLYGSPTSLNEIGAHAFVGRRQQHFDFTASAHLTFDPQRDGEEAGLTVYMNERFHYEIAVARIGGIRKVLLRRRLGSLWKIENEAPWNGDAIVLTVRA